MTTRSRSLRSGYGLIRLDPNLLPRLRRARRVLRKSAGAIVNDAVRQYLGRRELDVEPGMQGIETRLREYRRRDPDFSDAWRQFIDAETRLGAEDPVEGRVVDSVAPGPVQAAVRKLLKGS